MKQDGLTANDRLGQVLKRVPAVLIRLVLFALCLVAQPSDAIIAASVDRIVAVVDSDVILQSELNNRVASIKNNVLASGAQLPPDSIIREQVLERMIITMLQRKRAESMGIHAEDEIMRESLQKLAQQNGLTVEEFQAVLREEKIDYAEFLEDMRNQIIINRLRGREVDSHIRVTDPEIQHYLETQGGEQEAEYHLAHMLVATPENATPLQIEQARQQAANIIEQIKQGTDFQRLALRVSAGARTVNSADLGWRKLSQVPSLFADAVVKMKPDQVEGPMRSPSGFHIIKLLEYRGISKHIVMQTQVRHILIKTNDLMDDDKVKERLLALKRRMVDGDSFELLARAHSDDKGSALRGGDLGWVSPGELVPAFEEAMNRLKVNEISDPVKTQFGWHVIQVLGRQERDNTEEYRKTQAREALRQRKIEEETGLWLRRMRDEAYVEIRIDR